MRGSVRVGLAPGLIVAADPGELAERAAREFTRLAREAVRQRGRFLVALAGGTTPAGMYSRLSRPPFGRALPWQAIQVFWSDERHVPPGHEASNFRLAYTNLLSKVPIPRENVHRVLGEATSASWAASDYARRLRAAAGSHRWPQLDLAVLGLGPDGHTASLFPGSPELRERRRLVIVARAPAEPRRRITLTLPVLARARALLFLVSGTAKASALAEAFRGSASGKDSPAGLLARTAGERALWLADRSAAGKLPREICYHLRRIGP